MTSIGKENRSSQYLSYKEQYGRRGWGIGNGVCVCVCGGGGGGGVGRQSEGLGGVVWVYKIGLK